MEKPKKLLTLVAKVVVATALLSGFAQSQPNKVTRIIVPYTPGGGVDNLARALTRVLQTELGETVIVENKPGAGGNIAMEYVASSPPDGRTLVLTTNSLTINQLLYANLKFDAQKSFAPVILLAQSPVLFLAKPSLPLSDLKDVIRYAKEHKGQLSYASCGNGTIHHFAGELLKSLSSVDITHIPYKGCSVAMTDLVGGQVDLGVISLTTAAPFIFGKQVKPLAIAGAKRSRLVPDVPTVAEAASLPKYSLLGWYGLLAPKATPPAVVDRLNAALNRALKDEDVKKSLTAGQLEPVGGGADILSGLITIELASYRQIVKDAGIKAD